MCIEHEIVERITGLGAQSVSCQLPTACNEYSAGQKNHCAKRFVGTYNGMFGDGSRSSGGYSERVRVPMHFVKIPDALSSAAAAPMLCSGITVYAPLKRNGAGLGTRVEIVGVGGLGHFGLLFARALGCGRVVAISRIAAKKQDALAMGVDAFIATDEDEAWNRKHSCSLDLFVQSLVWSSPLSFVLRGLPTKLSASTQL